MPSFPRRRESCLIFRKFLKNNSLHKFNQDSRLRGNDGELTISCGVLGFAKVSGCLTLHNCLMLLPIPLRPAERSVLFSGKSVRLFDDVRSTASSHAPKKGCAVREVWRSQTCTSGSPFFCQNLYSLSARADFVFSEYEYKATSQVNSETISLAWQRSRRVQ